MRLLLRFSTVLGGLLLLTAPSFGQSVVHFEDNFDGASIDFRRWRTDILTDGVRWCDPNPGYAWGPGAWIDPIVQGCYGVTEGPPYGEVRVSGGLASFSTPPGLRASPYAWTGPPSPGSPFPASGDFRLRIRMRYERMAVCGTGVSVVHGDDATPVGANSPISPARAVLQIWSSGSGVLLYGVGEGTSYLIPVSISDPLALHEYVVSLEGGAYTYFVDGVPVYGPVVASVRPSTIELGNPVLTYWAACDWSSFTLDYVGIEVPGATSIATCSWGALKSTYR